MSKSRREIPVPLHPIIETHFHLDMLKALTREEIVEKTLNHNIEKMITISTNPHNLDEVISISENFPQIYCTQGLHPHEGKEWNRQQCVIRHDAENTIRQSLQQFRFQQTNFDTYQTEKQAIGSERKCYRKTG